MPWNIIFLCFSSLITGTQSTVIKLCRMFGRCCDHSIISTNHPIQIAFTSTESVKWWLKRLQEPLWFWASWLFIITAFNTMFSQSVHPNQDGGWSHLKHSSRKETKHVQKVTASQHLQHHMSLSSTRLEAVSQLSNAAWPQFPPCWLLLILMGALRAIIWCCLWLLVDLFQLPTSRNTGADQPKGFRLRLNKESQSPKWQPWLHGNHHWWASIVNKDCHYQAPEFKMVGVTGW